MAKAAPKLAPWETPIVEAEARLFCKITWSIAPVKPRPAPETIEVSTLGSLLLTMIRLIFSSLALPKIPRNKSDNESLAVPNLRDTKEEKTNISSRDIKNMKFFFLFAL